MKEVKLSYNPYKLSTELIIDDFNVGKGQGYPRFKDYIENKIPLQTWIEPIPYKDWHGFVNELSDPENNDRVNIHFYGREIDFEDFKRSIEAQNEKRDERAKVEYNIEFKKKFDEKQLSEDIDYVVSAIKSERFGRLVEERSGTKLKDKYKNLDKNYKLAKNKDFLIILTGVYSAGKSTLLNVLMRHDILPMANDTCTKKNCRIRHDRMLGKRTSIQCFDEKGNAIYEKFVFEDDTACKEKFEEICPYKNSPSSDYNLVATIELGVDLSHLYPKSVGDDAFNIVLVDTPGFDSAESSTNGINAHAQIALDAITDRTKPMIILCADATKYSDDSIGSFMSEIISQSREDNSGFNDRFLFVMNKCDSIKHNNYDETLANAKQNFAQYLTDYSKWNINDDEKEQLERAASESKFVPRVFTTSAYCAFAIQKDAPSSSKEQRIKDTPLRELYKSYKDQCDYLLEYHDEKYRFSDYCDIPEYKKAEIYAAYERACEECNEVEAVKLQTGIIPIEIAIRDYIERYAYPIKVRDLLETFEDLLEDVKSFSESSLNDLERKKKELGERKGERKEEEERKKGVNEKIDALDSAKASIQEQSEKIDNINFDWYEVYGAIIDFKAEIENDASVSEIRGNRDKKIPTSLKTREEIEEEIHERIKSVNAAFKTASGKANKQMAQFKKKYDEQIVVIYKSLNDIIHDLENQGVFESGSYNFKNTVAWERIKNRIEDIEEEVNSSIVDVKQEWQSKWKFKKNEYRRSWNPFKKIASLFIDENEPYPGITDGYYKTSPILQKINDYMTGLDDYILNLQISSEDNLRESKERVSNILADLDTELTSYYEDMQNRRKRIEDLSKSINELDKEVEQYAATCSWLKTLSDRIGG